MNRRVIILTAVVIAGATVLALFFTSRSKNADFKQDFATVSGSASKTQAPVAAEARPAEKLEELAAEKIVFAKREVIEVAEDGTAKYKTTFLVTNPDGSRLYPSWTTDELGYVFLTPFGSRGMFIADAFGEAASRVVTLDGEPIAGVKPPMTTLPTDFLVSGDTTLELRYPAQPEDGTIVPPDVVVRRANTDEKVISGEKFKNQDEPYPYAILRGITPDAKTFFIEAVTELDETVHPSHTLFLVEAENGNVRELFHDDGLSGSGTLREFVGFSPSFDALYANTTNPAAEKAGTAIERLTLADGTWKTVYENNDGDFLSPERRMLLSPDGATVALQRSEAFGEGVSALDLASATVTTAVTAGEFLSWVSPTVFLTEVSKIEDEQITGLSWHAIDLASGTDTTLFSENTAESGTGLEEKGDVSYSFVGVYPKE